MIVGFSTSIYLYMLDKYSLVYYGDAVSHLVRAREFVDSARPGLLEQMGTGWLPLPHLLILPFALVDPLFKSGFAGTAISLPCFAITSVLIYRIIKAQININYIARNWNTTLCFKLEYNIPRDNPYDRGPIYVIFCGFCLLSTEMVSKSI